LTCSSPPGVVPRTNGKISVSAPRWAALWIMSASGSRGQPSASDLRLAGHRYGPHATVFRSAQLIAHAPETPSASSRESGTHRCSRCGAAAAASTVRRSASSPDVVPGASGDNEFLPIAAQDISGAPVIWVSNRRSQ
jgi:hypothetical protein